MHTGLSRGGLGQPWCQYLRSKGSDPDWTSGPGSADSRLRRRLDYCCGWLCFDNVRPSADRHRAGRRAIVYQWTLYGHTCLTWYCNVVPIQSCTRPRGLHRRPGERHRGSRCLAHRLSWSDSALWVHGGRLDYTVRRRGHDRNGQLFRQHWPTVDSCDRHRRTAVVPCATCHYRSPRRGCASWMLRVHSSAPIESLRRVRVYFPLVVRQRSCIAANKCFARVVSCSRVRAGRRCVHSWIMGTSLCWDPLHFNLLERTETLLVVMGHGSDTSRSFLCRLRRLLLVYTRRQRGK